MAPLPARIRSAAVLGAGTMGAQIAAHFANAGLPVLLLDVTREAARAGHERARALKPDPYFTRDTHRLIRTGGFEEDFAGLSDADWIVEAVVERLDVKQALFARVESAIGPAAIVTSNTSGIPIAALADGRTPGFRRRFAGSHFFNPPRYLKLLEVIPTPDTDPHVTEAIAAFADLHLGKGVVVAKDTPSFIANRLGLFGVAQIFRALESGDYTIEEIDAMTGPAIGRPASATFRTLDIAGIDILATVMRNLSERLDSGERAMFAPPALVEALIARGWNGQKSGRGFYRKEPSGEILTLDPATMEYRPPQAPRLPSLEGARTIADAGERLRKLYDGDDKVGRFLRATLAPTLAYAARVTPAIAHSPADVDRAMRWGFGWELGPFETMAALAFPGAEDGTRTVSIPESSRAARAVVRRNAGASLVDMGDGVLLVEFHSKMNAIGGDTIQMIHAAVKEAAAGFAAIVVGNDAPHFSAGANLMLLLLEAQEGNWDEVDLMVRAFQGATQALRLAEVPVVAAPAGLALGGGCEIALHADRVVAGAETYMGLVEAGVGLIPAGGGTKEMLARAMETAGGVKDVLPFVQRVFETIGFARVSASGPDAKRLGYLRDADSITMNRERLLADAKATALARVREYVRPQPRPAIRVGGEGLLAALKLGVHLGWRAGRLSDHDALIGRKLAWVLAGGNLRTPGTLSEQQVLDLEREAFLSLCGERKTQERIAHTLKTGKPLRN